MSKCLFSVFLGEGEAKLHPYSENELGPPDAWHGLGRRRVASWDCSPGF